MKLTQSQRDAAHAVDRHVLVAAGAGTGKTTTVVARLLYLLGVPVGGRTVSSPLELGRLAAITFTNAAAADLQGKLRTALRDAGRRDAAYEVDTARIGTIHGFCADVLREFALRHARPPAREVLSEGQSSALIAEAVRDGLLAALEARSVAGLDQLLAERSVRDVEQWVLALLGESDRLRALSANRQTLGARERALVDLAREVLTLVEARLVERGAVDFDRMIVWTRDLLRDDGYTRRTLQRRLHTLVVDEFQDVDPVQQEIAYLLGEPASRRDDTTRLLLVGDPKQSIYRFRRADVTVWAQVERDFGPGGHGQVIPLVDNFRSSNEILGFVDATVGTILSQPLDGSRHQPYEVPYQSLLAKQGRGPKGAGVELLLVLSTMADGRDRSAAELRRLEAQAMARRARALHQDGVGWGEMAVLLASWGALATYQTALEAVGAPTYAPRASGFWERREVLDVIVALEAIRNPNDDAALFGFLRSPMVGITDETLLAVARQIPTPYWPRLDSVIVREGERLARGLALLRRHARLRDRVRTDQLIESLLDESGYVGHLALLGEHGTQAIANVRKLVTLARGMRHAGLGELLRTVRETRARGDIEPDARLHVAGDDVLTLTSIHQAKGLEWRVVFWCDLIRWMMRESGSLLLGRDRIALDDPEAERDEDQPEGWRRLAETIGREEEAEYRRQWYVAVTRAKERLVVSGLPIGQQVKPKLETPAGWLWRTLPPLMALDGTDVEYAGSDGARHRALVRVADATITSVTAAGPTPWHVSDAAALDVPRAPIAVATGARRHSATELLTLSRCETKHWFRYRLGLREPRVDTTTPEFIAAVTRGQIVHHVLERLAEDDQLDLLLEDAIGRWAEDAPAPETPPGRRYRKVLREEIAAVAAHPDYRAVADRPTARRELAFIHVGGPDAIWAGSVDLAAGDGDGVVLLDVKTSRGGPDDARHKVVHYVPQRDVYVVATEAIGGLEVRQFAYQFSRAGLQVSEPIDGKARARAGARLAEGLTRMAGALPRLTEFPAECRFCGYRRVGWCPGVDPVAAPSLDARGASELG